MTVQCAIDRDGKVWSHEIDEDFEALKSTVESFDRAFVYVPLAIGADVVD